MTITIPDDLRRMRRVKNVSWSEVARRAFEEELRRLEREEAAREMDRLRGESRGWSGVEEIRRWRDSR